MPRGQTCKRRSSRYPVPADGPHCRKTPARARPRQFAWRRSNPLPDHHARPSHNLSIPLDSRDFERGQLNQPSFIRPQRLFTVEQRLIIYTVGNIQKRKLQEVLARARELFA